MGRVTGIAIEMMSVVLEPFGKRASCSTRLLRWVRRNMPSSSDAPLSSNVDEFASLRVSYSLEGWGNRLGGLVVLWPLVALLVLWPNRLLRFLGKVALTCDVVRAKMAGLSFSQCHPILFITK